MNSRALLAMMMVGTLAACTNSGKESVLAKSLGAALFDGKLTDSAETIANTTVLILGYTETGMYGCTGSVLSSNVILTASHCVSSSDEATKTTKVNPTNAIAILDSAKLRQLMEQPDATGSLEGAVIAKAAQIIANPVYLAQQEGDLRTYASSAYDVALIKLDRALPSNYKPVVLSENFDELKAEQIRAAGYGISANGAGASQDFKLRDGLVNVDLSLKEFTMAVKNENDSAGGMRDFSSKSLNTSAAALIGFKKKSGDASVCHGDSGGPLYFEKNGQIHLVGVNVAITSTENCVNDSDSYQFSVAVAGQQIHFIQDAYKELTGSALSTSRGDAVNDPITFDYQLQSANLNPKNSIASLDGYSVVQDTANNGQITLISKEWAVQVCNQQSPTDIQSLFIYGPITLKELDGKTSINVVVIENNVARRIVEARMQLLNQSVKMVVLTSEGYISADVPFLNCAK